VKGAAGDSQQARRNDPEQERKDQWVSSPEVGSAVLLNLGITSLAKRCSMAWS
jgi:hypothetical protein